MYFPLSKECGAAARTSWTELVKLAGCSTQLQPQIFAYGLFCLFWLVSSLVDNPSLVNTYPLANATLLTRH